jgi:hypothetical protein
MSPPEHFISRAALEELEREAMRIVNELRPLLAGYSPEIQGLVLAELAAMWIAGHHAEIRKPVRATFIETMDHLVRFWTNGASKESGPC